MGHGLTADYAGHADSWGIFRGIEVFTIGEAGDSFNLVRVIPRNFSVNLWYRSRTQARADDCAIPAVLLDFRKESAVTTPSRSR